jgi:hypothetical protein
MIIFIVSNFETYKKGEIRVLFALPLSGARSYE